MGDMTAKMTGRHFDPLADNEAGTVAVASLLGVEDGPTETPADTRRAEPAYSLTLDDERRFRPPSDVLAVLTERYSNIAIGKILDVSAAAVWMMLKRAGIRRTNRVFSSLEDWQAAIIRADPEGGIDLEGKGEWDGGCGLMNQPLGRSFWRTESIRSVKKGRHWRHRLPKTI
jgi:hypothetical protein